MLEPIGDECWLPIEGYEDLYEVSDWARVRSLDRVLPHTRLGTYRRRGRLLVQFVDQQGYLRVRLDRDRYRWSRQVHKLVAPAFLGPCPEGLIVRHGPNGQQDNRPSNLSYGTHSENNRDKRRDGTDPYVNRTHCPRGHLLATPNLVACHTRIGQRGCLACDRAHAWLRWILKRDGKQLDMQVESDRYYMQIMGGAAA